MTAEGYVYFIKSGASGHIKIGHSADPARRCKDLATANPSELWIITTIPGTQADERTLHQQFREDRVKGEWFRASEPLLQFIESVTPSNEPDRSPLLTVAQAAAQLGVRSGFVYRHSAELGGIKVGSYLRFRESRIDAYVARQRVTEPVEPAPTPISAARPPLTLKVGPVGKVTGHVYAPPRQAERVGGGGR